MKTETLFTLLKDVSLTVEEGEFVAVIGTNGSGNRRWQNISMRYCCLQAVVCEIDGMRTDNVRI